MYTILIRGAPCTKSCARAISGNTHGVPVLWRVRNAVGICVHGPPPIGEKRKYLTCPQVAPGHTRTYVDRVYGLATNRTRVAEFGRESARGRERNFECPRLLEIPSPPERLIDTYMKHRGYVFRVRKWWRTIIGKRRGGTREGRFVTEISR